MILAFRAYSDDFSYLFDRSRLVLPTRLCTKEFPSNGFEVSSSESYFGTSFSIFL